VAVKLFIYTLLTITSISPIFLEALGHHPFDQDQDGVTDPQDNCPEVYNPGQGDADKDYAGDVCDNDMDGDEIPNETDRCPLKAYDCHNNIDSSKSNVILDERHVVRNLNQNNCFQNDMPSSIVFAIFCAILLLPLVNMD